MKNLSLKFYIYLISSVGWFISILYLLIFYSNNSSEISIDHLDKAIHFILFFVQAFLIAQVIISYDNRVRTKNFIIIFILLIIFGSIMEVQQIYLPMRKFEYYDLLFNLLGITSGLFCSIYIKN
tara:strand:- start:686 stop:1057 length:372 start_codon:yes stop_codon:yes gene_type:complete